MGKTYEEMEQEKSVGMKFRDAYTFAGFTVETASQALEVETSRLLGVISGAEDITLSEFERWCQALNLDLKVDGSQAMFL